MAEISRHDQRKQVTDAFRGYAARGENPNTAETIGRDVWLSDMAVSATLSVLRAEDKAYIVDAVAKIYFIEPTVPLRKNEIEQRVTHYCMTGHVCRRSVYNWLAHARKLYWAIYHGGAA